jgi:hypothetical protein
MAALIALESTSFVRRAINRIGLNAAQHHQCAAFRTVRQLGLFHYRHRELIAPTWSSQPTGISAERSALCYAHSNTGERARWLG